jgi:quinoprotein glucose dehydrogenase
MTTPRAAVLALIPFALFAGLRLRAAPGDAGRDWPEYLGGPGRNHYSPLEQINASNVGRLKVAWEFHSGDAGQMQCNPIIVDGVLYGATATSQIFALDASSGRQLWRFTHPHEFDDLENDRGVTYWSQGKERRILCTVGSWLYALDAATGQPIPDFGAGGRVSLKCGLGPGAQEKWVVSTTPGTLYGDLLVMPTRVGEDQDAAPGFIQAFNVRTGTVAWVFRTMPYPTDAGYETWASKEAYKNIDVGSANCWAGMAIDRRRGILYVPTGSAAPDFWGGHRLGKGLYADCLLALDAATGRLLWYFQGVHHDMWDRDFPSPPVLATLHRLGRRVDAVIQTTKTGFVFAFDRVTGQPLFPIEEKPFPASELDGEQAWPTQPIPELPKPYARQVLTEADISPFAENRDELLALIRRARSGLFQPFGKYETILFPGFDGGGEWGGPAVDPDGVLYVNANEMAWVASLSDAPKESDLEKMSPGKRLYTQYCVGCHGLELKGLPAGGIPPLVDVGARHPREEIIAQITTGRRMMPGFPMLSSEDKATLVSFLLGDDRTRGAGAAAASTNPTPPPRIPYRFNGYDRFVDSKGYPATTPPWGSLTAIDMNTGLQSWRVPLGEFKELTAKGIPPTGTENYGGPVVTAGNLLFIAATKDGMIRAFDKRTGALLWKFTLPAAGFATPSTYLADGRQFLVVACGGGKLGTPKGDSYVAFALPR